MQTTPDPTADPAIRARIIELARRGGMNPDDFVRELSGGAVRRLAPVGQSIPALDIENQVARIAGDLKAQIDVAVMEMRMQIADAIAELKAEVTKSAAAPNPKPGFFRRLRR